MPQMWLSTNSKTLRIVEFRRMQIITLTSREMADSAERERESAREKWRDQYGPTE